MHDVERQKVYKGNTYKMDSIKTTCRLCRQVILMMAMS